ncbi:hypothetical protein MHU86_22463 [Fragilaria crotonensis]|nr:hypothetical protein MHU86_22463 [Fragilaria crotonensis]
MDSSASSLSKGLLPVAVPEQQVFIILDGNSSGIELELTFQPTSNADGRSNGVHEIRPARRRRQDATGNTHAAAEVCQQDLYPLIEELELTNFTGRLFVTLRTKGLANDLDATINTGSPDAQKSILSPSLRSIGAGSWTSSTPVKIVPPQKTFLNATESSTCAGNLDENMTSRISDERNHPSEVPEIENVVSSEIEVVEFDGSMQSESWDQARPSTFYVPGQTPLHILTDNHLLWSSHHARERRVDAHVFALELVGINPAAAASVDSQDGWPCQSLLQQWIDQQELDREKDSKGYSLSNFVRRGMGTVISLATSKKSLFSLSPIDGATGISDRELRNFAPSRLTLSFESALNVLSLAMTSISLADEIRDTESVVLQQKICVNIATHVPHLLPRLLLLEPEQERHRIFNLPLIRRLLLEPLATGPWLVSMVRHNGLVSRRRAIDYLLLLSDCSIDHFYPGGNVIVEVDDSNEMTELGKAFRKSQSQVFKALGDMGGELILSLAVVDDKELCRATSGRALWYILHQGLMRPFVIGIVFFDFVLHITLLLSFRSDVMVSGDQGVLSAIPSAVVTAITVFFVARKVSVGMALWSISRSVFKAHILDFWNLFDLLSITLVLTINSVNRGAGFSNPSLNAFVLGLLWLKVLSFLRAVNMQMATFIFSLVRIVLDIRSFIVVLVVVIMMFGDIMVIMFTTTNDEQTGQPLCPGDSDAQSDFCSGQLVDSYLRMYGVLLGDFEVNDYLGNTSTTAVFLAFTVLGVIILLNVLIAIPGQNPLASLHEDGSILDPHRCATIVSRVLRWVVLLGMLTTVLFAEVFLVRQAVGALLGDRANILLMAFLISMSTILTVALWTVFHFLFSSAVASLSCLSGIAYIIGCIDVVMTKLVNLIRNVLFGDLSAAEGGEKDEADEWAKHISHVESTILAAISESDQHAILRIKAAESNLKAHELTLAERLETAMLGITK